MKPVQHSHHSHQPGKTAITVLLAVGFLALVMFLSYIFIASTVK